MELSVFWPWLPVGAGFTVLLLAAGHWAPWEPPLSLLGRYVYGVSAIAAGLLIWRLGIDDWIAPAGLLFIAAAGGITVWACYRIDALVVKLRQARKAAHDEELSQP